MISSNVTYQPNNHLKKLSQAIKKNDEALVNKVAQKIFYSDLKYFDANLKSKALLKIVKYYIQNNQDISIIIDKVQEIYDNSGISYFKKKEALYTEIKNIFKQKIHNPDLKSKALLKITNYRQDISIIIGEFQEIYDINGVDLTSIVNQAKALLNFLNNYSNKLPTTTLAELTKLQNLISNYLKLLARISSLQEEISPLLQDNSSSLQKDKITCLQKHLANISKIKKTVYLKISILLLISSIILISAILIPCLLSTKLKKYIPFFLLNLK